MQQHTEQPNILWISMPFLSSFSFVVSSNLVGLLIPTAMKVMPIFVIKTSHPESGYCHIKTE